MAPDLFIYRLGMWASGNLIGWLLEPWKGSVPLKDRISDSLNGKRWEFTVGLGVICITIICSSTHP
jgi:hypothetical protein